MTLLEETKLSSYAILGCVSIVEDIFMPSWVVNVSAYQFICHNMKSKVAFKTSTVPSGVYIQKYMKFNMPKIVSKYRARIYWRED